MDLVVLGLAGAAVPPTRARAVVARARSKGSCLVVTEGRWDGADIRIDSHVTNYTGIGQGYGRITGFSVDIEVKWAGGYAPVRQVRSEPHSPGSGVDGPRSRTIGSASTSAGAMTAPDFNGWQEPWPLTPTLRPLLPQPQPVIVEANRALPLAKNATRPDKLPLRVLAGGLRLEGTMPKSSMRGRSSVLCTKQAFSSETRRIRCLVDPQDPGARPPRRMRGCRYRRHPTSSRQDRHLIRDQRAIAIEIHTPTTVEFDKHRRSTRSIGPQKFGVRDTGSGSGTRRRNRRCRHSPSQFNTLLAREAHTRFCRKLLTLNNIAANQLNPEGKPGPGSVFHCGKTSLM